MEKNTVLDALQNRYSLALSTVTGYLIKALAFATVIAETF